ncbi:hypothetical protein NJB14197_20910, partial [Mycobacterium montefiorense]
SPIRAPAPGSGNANCAQICCGSATT